MTQFFQPFPGILSCCPGAMQCIERRFHHALLNTKNKQHDSQCKHSTALASIVLHVVRCHVHVQCIAMICVFAASEGPPTSSQLLAVSIS